MTNWKKQFDENFQPLIDAGAKVDIALKFVILEFIQEVEADAEERGYKRGTTFMGRVRGGLQEKALADAYERGVNSQKTFTNAKDKDIPSSIAQAIRDLKNHADS